VLLMGAIRSDGGFEAMLNSMRVLADEGLDMRAAAGNVDAFMRGQLAKGETPEGEKWKPTKKGTKPLKGAAVAYTQRVVGRAIVMKIVGRYAFHHFGAGYNPVRAQLPEGQMPAELGNAIRMGLVDDFKAKTKAGKIGYRKSGKVSK
jgi:hypothetical protein